MKNFCYGRFNSEMRNDNGLKTDPSLLKQMIIIFVISALIIIISVLSGLSTQPKFCGTCHGQEYKSWKKSGHRASACNSCHRRPGFTGIMTQRIDMIRMVAKYRLRSDFEPSGTPIVNKSCLRCHANLISRSMSKNGIRMSHLEPDEAGYRCVDCHGGTAHGTDKPNIKRYSMGTCLSCHNGDQTQKCETCHVETTPLERRQVSTAWRITHGKNWRKLHGMADLKTCVACHRSGDYCRRCHQTEMPHPETWANVHGEQARASLKSCKVCHTTGFCYDCHGLEMPHPNSFLKQHPSIEKKVGQETCNRCHQPDSCNVCHSLHIHPGIKPDAISDLRRKAGLGN